MREAIAHKTLSIGVAPALADDAPPLLPLTRANGQRLPGPALTYELPDPSFSAATRYTRLRVIQEPDAPGDVGVVQLELPGATGAAHLGVRRADELRRLSAVVEDEQVRARPPTRPRIKVAAPATAGVSASPVIARVEPAGHQRRRRAPGGHRGQRAAGQRQRRA